MPNWKKVIVSGSNAHLNHVTASGNVSASSTSTGSFGSLVVSDKVQGELTFGGCDSQTGELLVGCKNHTVLKIDEIQIEGKKVVSSKEFIQGYKALIQREIKFSGNAR